MQYVRDEKVAVEGIYNVSVVAAWSEKSICYPD